MKNRNEVLGRFSSIIVPNHIPTSSESMKSRIDIDKISKHADVFINHENGTIKIKTKHSSTPVDKNGDIIEETVEELVAKIEKAYEYVVATGRGDKIKKDEISVETRLGRFYSIKEGFYKTIAERDAKNKELSGEQ